MSGFVEEPIYSELSRVGKALSNPVRLRLLDLLDSGELSVEQLAALAGLPVKNTSAQLQELRSAQLVSSRRDGTRIVYRIASSAVSEFLGQLHGFAQGTLAELRHEIETYLGTGDQEVPITVSELGALVPGRDITVLDVRPSADFARAHVPGAISLPIGDLAANIDTLPRRRPIVAYCQGPYCVSSPNAVRQLTSAGRRARILSGGWTAWARSGQSQESS